MARTNATNFTGGLQFPYATAAADIFKKEDVQVLAQAVDQHDHSSGKGLVLSPASIPAGLITSAMIADGTITSADILDGTIGTVDLAGGAVTAITQVGAVVSNPSTTSTTLVDIPDMTITLSSPVAEVLRVDFNGIFYVNSATGLYYITLDIDGTAPSGGGGTQVIEQTGVVNGYSHAALFGFLSVGAGSHTIKARWQTSASTTLAGVAAFRSLAVTEFRR